MIRFAYSAFPSGVANLALILLISSSLGCRDIVLRFAFVQLRCNGHPCLVPTDVDEVGALFGEVLEGPVLPVAQRSLKAEGRDRDLALEQAGGARSMRSDLEVQ